MYLDKVFIDQAFSAWINLLEQSVDTFKEQYPELYNFWFENFTFYLAKLKKRVKNTNPRRNFQGQIVNYLLSLLEPTLVINFFTGALKNLHDTFSQDFFGLNSNHARMEDEKNHDTFFLWINIDLLPTSIRTNCEYLEDVWNISSYPIPDTKYAQYSVWPTGIMLHLCGDLSQLPNYYTSITNITATYQHKLLLGIEGIMNLPIFTKNTFNIWWNSFGSVVRHFDAFFGSWMAAGDRWKGLKTKIVFYQDVVKVNHQQPLFHGQMIPFMKDKNILEERIILFSDTLPWDMSKIDECIKNISSNIEGIILEYYMSPKADPHSLRFISSYITESGLLHLAEKIVAPEYLLKVGYSDWNDLIGVNMNPQKKEKVGFVKIFPFGFIAKNVFHEK